MDVEILVFTIDGLVFIGFRAFRGCRSLSPKTTIYEPLQGLQVYACRGTWTLRVSYSEQGSLKKGRCAVGFDTVDLRYEAIQRRAPLLLIQLVVF